MSEQTRYVGWRSVWAKSLMIATAALLLQAGAFAAGPPPGGAVPQSARTTSGGRQNPVSSVQAKGGPEAADSMNSFAGKRDPFKISPPPLRSPKEESGTRGPLPPGKRGLMINQLRLEGVVRQDANHSMIAVVANQSNRAYFLKIHDEVYDGVVTRITADSIYFNQNQLDVSGQVVTREVIKKMGLPPGEAR